MKRRLFCFLIAIVLVINSFCLTFTVEASEAILLQEGEGFTVEYRIDSCWESGCNASIIITNTSEDTISDWEIELSLDGKVDMWNAQYEKTNDIYVIKPCEWNKSIKKGKSVIVGLNVNGSENNSNVKIVNTLTSRENTKDNYIISNGKIEVEYQIVSKWSNASQVKVIVNNTTDETIHNWGFVIFQTMNLIMFIMLLK